jgi:hypothetical protein
MAIHIQSNNEEIMKVVFTLLLMCSFGYLLGQDDNIKIGGIKFKTISLFRDLITYHALCENRDDYQFASRSVIRYDSTTHIGYLGSYKYVDKFDCRDSIGHSVMEQIKTLLSKERKVHNKIGILFSMEDENKEFIGVLFLFKKKKFKKFTRKANRLTKRTFSGEVMMVREYDYSKYAKEFILAKTGNKLSLISVSPLF